MARTPVFIYKGLHHRIISSDDTPVDGLDRELATVDYVDAEDSSVIAYVDQEISNTSAYINQEISNTSAYIDQEIDTLSSYTANEFIETSAYIDQEISNTSAYIDQEIDTLSSYTANEFINTSAYIDQEIDTLSSYTANEFINTSAYIDQEIVEMSSYVDGLMLNVVTMDAIDNLSSYINQEIVEMSSYVNDAVIIATDYTDQEITEVSSYINNRSFDYYIPEPNLGEASGIKEYDSVGESVDFPDLLYLGSDGKWWRANASSVATMPGMRLALETTDPDTVCEMLVLGRVQFDSWSWNTGGFIYADTVDGGLTQTAPSISGDQVQVIGIARDTDKMIFQPSPIVMEIE